MMTCLINLSGESEPGDYDEKSIRYTGRNIPSKSFRLLQSMTGGPGGDSTPPTGSETLANHTTIYDIVMEIITQCFHA